MLAPRFSEPACSPTRAACRPSPERSRGSPRLLTRAAYSVDDDVELPRPWAVELAEEHGLQIGEAELAVDERDRHRRGCQCRADVRPRVAVTLRGVLPVRALVDDPLEP